MGGGGGGGRTRLSGESNKVCEVVHGGDQPLPLARDLAAPSRGGALLVRGLVGLRVALGQGDASGGAGLDVLLGLGKWNNHQETRESRGREREREAERERERERIQHKAEKERWMDVSEMQGLTK